VFTAADWRKSSVSPPKASTFRAKC
jgi:hypothetical protein